MDFSLTNDYSLQLAVTDYENEETNKKQHTLYIVEIRTDNLVYYVKKRFKSFELLHNSLKRKSLSQQEKIPFSSFVEFPSKHLYTRTQKTFESRRASLDIYVKKLVEYYELASQFPNDLNEFLELDKQQTTATSRTLRSFTKENLTVCNESMSNTPTVGINEIKSNELFSIINDLKKDSVIQGVISAFYN